VIAAMEPTNIPCGRCGAPMREVNDGDTSHLAATVPMRCSYCGAVEQLPVDAQQRVLALRSLRIQRRWAEDAATGPALTYLKIVEGDTMFLAPYAMAAVMLVAMYVLTRPASLFPIGVIAGSAVATFLALRIARPRLRRTLGPLIRAFPGVPGRPQRCRRCGGELPATTHAFVECTYCNAPNLASRAVAAANAAALVDRRSEALAYARDTTDEVAAAGRFVSRALYVAAVVGMVGGGMIAAVLE
jgi:DNA-directed RNA polymerase subunit RPC12/RpoP